MTHGDGGKGDDQRPEGTKGAYTANYPQIDWNAREREAEAARKQRLWLGETVYLVAEDTSGRRVVCHEPINTRRNGHDFGVTAIDSASNDEETPCEEPIARILELASGNLAEKVFNLIEDTTP